MIQEIITYMILGAAITLATIKVKNRFWHRKSKISNQNNEKSSSLPNCSNCSAECVMRDISPQSNQYNKDLCNKVKLN